MRPFNMIYDAERGRGKVCVARLGTGGLLEGTRNCSLRNSGILVFERFVDFLFFSLAVSILSYPTLKVDKRSFLAHQFFLFFYLPNLDIYIRMNYYLGKGNGYSI